MNAEIAVSTIAYTQMGVELVLSGILTIAMHYGVAANPPLAGSIYVGAVTGFYQYPVWGGVFAILVGIVGIIVGSAIQRTTNSIKGVSFVGFIGFLTQFIAFCFSCNSIATSVAYLRIGNHPNPAYIFSPLIFSIIYLLIFLANFAVCIRFMYLGRAIIRGTAVIVQPTSTTVVIQQTTVQSPQQPPPGYNATYGQPGQPMQPGQPGYAA